LCCEPSCLRASALNTKQQAGCCCEGHHACEHRHSRDTTRKKSNTGKRMDARYGIHAGKSNIGKGSDARYGIASFEKGSSQQRSTGLYTCFTLMHHKTGWQKKGVQDQAICANIAAAAIEPTTCRIALLVKLAPPALGPSPPKSFSVTPQVSSVDAQSSVSCAA